MNQFLFGVLPYIAIVTLIVGSIARYDRDPYTWKASSSELLRKRQLAWGSNLFHFGILFIFFGHLIGLLTPIWVFDAMGISHSAKQLLAAVAGGIAGVAALIGAGLLIHRRLFDPRIRASSRFSDNMIIVLLGVQLMLGVISVPVSLSHLDGHEMVNLMAWANGIFTFDGQAASYIEDAQFIFKAHIVLGLIIFMVFPFTRLVHMFSGFAAPFKYFFRSGYQIVRTRKVKGRE